MSHFFKPNRVSLVENVFVFSICLHNLCDLNYAAALEDTQFFNKKEGRQHLTFDAP